MKTTNRIMNGIPAAAYMKNLKKRKKGKPETVKIGHAVVKIYPHRKKIKGRKDLYVTWQVADFTGASGGLEPLLTTRRPFAKLDGSPV